jgi:hypothetical protein
MILTHKGLHNSKNESVRKNLPYDLMIGVTVSNISDEFVVHGERGK